jgi:hypothetical protein
MEKALVRLSTSESNFQSDIGVFVLEGIRLVRCLGMVFTFSLFGL